MVSGSWGEQAPQNMAPPPSNPTGRQVACAPLPEARHRPERPTTMILTALFMAGILAPGRTANNLFFFDTPAH